VLGRLNTEIVKAVNSRELRAPFDDAALAVIGNSPEQFAALLKNGFDVYEKAIAAAGLKAE